MMSSEMQRVWKVAEKLELEVARGDLYGSVLLQHEDGTVLFYNYAFLMRYYDPEHGNWGACSTPGQWILVFTEHHGFHVYPVDDLTAYRQMGKSVQIAKHPDYPEDKWTCEDCGVSFIEPIYPKVGAKFCPWCGLDNIKEIKQ